MAIGEAIRTKRQSRGLTMEALARRADVSLSTVARIEGGHNEPRLDVLRKLAVALNVSIDELVAA